MALFQLGGFGMMTLATLLGLLVNRSFRLRAKLIAQAESHVLGLGDISSVAKLVLVVTLVMELAVMLLLTLRLHLSYGLGWGEAARSGLFHSVSAFNNAGFSIHVDGLVRYATDGFILLPVMSAIIIGGIGFPYSTTCAAGGRTLGTGRCTKLTLSGTAVLLVGGFMAVLLFEWSNPGTLGPMAWADKLLRQPSFRSRRVRPVSMRSISAR